MAHSPSLVADAVAPPPSPSPCPTPLPIPHLHKPAYVHRGKAAGEGVDAPADDGSVEGVDPTLAEMAAQAAVELASMQSLTDMHGEIDEAQAELRLARQSLGLAQATVDSASGMLATLGGVVAGLEGELSRFDALPSSQRTAEATTLYVAAPRFLLCVCVCVCVCGTGEGWCGEGGCFRLHT